MRPALLATLSVILAGTATAQKTWIVDKNAGPGYDFTQVQPAVNAAKAGDHIVVRADPYGYQPFQVSKGLWIPGPGAKIRATPTVSTQILRVPRGERLVLEGFEFLPSGGPLGDLIVSDCKGTVHLDQIKLQPSILRGPTLAISSCDAVTLRGCDLLFGLTSWKSNVTLSECSGAGQDGTPPTPAVLAFASLVRIMGGSGSRYQSGKPVASAGAPALLGQGGSALGYDPRTSLVASGNSKPIEGFVTKRIRRYPFLFTSGNQVGRTLTITVRGSNSEAFAVFAGLPAPPVALPPFGEIWFDVRTHILVGAGVHDMTESASVQVPVPNNQALAGKSIVWQGLGGLWPTLDFTNAEVTTLR